jgi:hypothetical protein
VVSKTLDVSKMFRVWALGTKAVTTARSCCHGAKRFAFADQSELVTCALPLSAVSQPTSTPLPPLPPRCVVQDAFGCVHRASVHASRADERTVAARSDKSPDWHSVFSSLCAVVSVCAVVLCVQAVAGNEPALSCAADAASSSNPCCSLLSAFSVFSDQTTLDIYFRSDRGQYVLCLEDNPVNTVNAQNNQADVNQMTALYNSQNCWGGQIARAPGSGVLTLNTRQDYARRLQRAHCTVPYQVDGNWTGTTLFAAAAHACAAICAKNSHLS